MGVMNEDRLTLYDGLIKTHITNTTVAKEAGKGLSTNDYTTTEKNKLAGIADGANKTIVDSTLNTSSENPVQNKVIYTEFEKKLNTDGDSKDLTNTFVSQDSTNVTQWTDVDVLASAEKHSSVFNKISTMFKNIRYLYKMLGTADISTLGEGANIGTVTGAISKLNSDMVAINSEISSEQIDISSSVAKWSVYDVGFDIRKYDEIEFVIGAKDRQNIVISLKTKVELFFKTNVIDPVVLCRDNFDPTDQKSILCCIYSPTKIYVYLGESVVISRTDNTIIKVNAYKKYKDFTNQ